MTTGPYASAARRIRAAGYSPIPIAPGTKSGKVPAGFTGYDGAEVSGEDVDRWCTSRPDDSIAARLPRHVVGLDVDAYNERVAADTLTDLEARLGPLPRTCRVSSRFDDDYDTVSGIRLFRLPPEYAAKAGDRNAGWRGGWPNIELIRYAHRFVMAPPSMHPKRGTPYRVLWEETNEITDALPAVDELPLLPEAWCEDLFHSKEGRERNSTAHSEYWTDGTSCVAVNTALGQALQELEGGRHDNALAGVLRLTRLGEQGHRGVRRAVDTLCGAFTSSVTAPGEGQRSPDEAQAEWQRMVEHVDDGIRDAGITSEADRGCCSSDRRNLMMGSADHPLPPIVTLDEARGTFKRWFGEEYDLDALHATAAAVAVERLDGDAPWLLIVGGSGNAKTETVSAARGAGALVTSTISSEGALLSATSAKERSRDANGGLLRRIGSRGVLVIKDVTSILSMSRDARASVLGALREVADGYWERNVGTDGGRSLTWSGRIVTIGAVTTAWDTHHAVIASMGDRFLLLRIDSVNPTGRRSSGRQALANLGREEQMRAELREAFGGLIAGMTTDVVTLTEDEQSELLSIADFVTLARTPVERDPRGNPTEAHAPEAPTRLAKYLGQILRGAVAIGMPRDEALQLAVRIGRDCLPPMRLLAIKTVAENPDELTAETARLMQRPYTSTDRVLQELQLLGILRVSTRLDETGWRYRITADAVAGACNRLIGEPSSSPEMALQARKDTKKVRAAR